MRSIQREQPQTSISVPVPQGMNVASIIERMKEAYEVSSDNELAKLLGLAKTTISSWRRRNSVPMDVCLRVAVDARGSLDYLITGKKRQDMFPGMYNTGIDVGLLSVCVYAMDKKQLGRWLGDGYEKSALRARGLALDYARSEELMKEALKQGNITKDEFLSSLRKTFDALFPIEEADHQPPARADDEKLAK